MKSLKKSLVFLVVLAVVLSTIAPVFAATPTDVVGTPYEDSVGKLVTLGIISGYEDGTYKPDQNITRAEFSKIACYVVGVKDAAELSKGTTKFSDVPASHWASGFINVASEKGLIKGYPDGTFKPEANVTYAEAITILVRALGMAKVVEGVGTWPANYLAKAASAGITADVSLSATGNAVRGAIAQLSWNTMTAEEWGEIEYNTNGIVYGPTGKSLLKDQYNDYSYKVDNKYVAKEFTGVTVVGTQLVGLGGDNDKILVKTSDQADLKTLLNAGDTAQLTVLNPTATDLNALFGRKVDLLLGKDNKVAYIKASGDAVAGNITKFNTTDTKVTVNNTDYAFTSDAKVYLNGVQFMATDKPTFTDMKNLVGQSTVNATLVLDGGRIAYANIVVLDALDFSTVGSYAGLSVAEKAALDAVTMRQGVVKEIKSSNNVVTDLNGATLFDLDDVTSNTKTEVIYKDGKPATTADLKVGDAVTYINAGSIYVLNISDNKVTGKVTRVATDDNGNNLTDIRRKLTVDGKEYSMVADGTVLATKTGKLDDVADIDANVSDFSGEDATLTLNALGDIVLVNGSVKASSTLQVGVVTKDLTENAGSYNIKILTPSGTTVTYVTSGEHYYDLVGSGATTLADTSANERDFDNMGIADDPATLAVNEADQNDDLVKGAVVAYDAASDNKIDGSRLFVITGCSINDGDFKVVRTNTITAVDKSNKLIDTTPNPDVTYYANSSTTYLNKNSANIEKVDGWSAVVNSTSATRLNGVFDYLVYDSDNILKEVITDFNATGTPYYNTKADYAIYVDQYSTSSDDYITLYVNGANKDYVISGSIANGTYGVGDLVKYEVNGDGDFDATTDAQRADVSSMADVASDVYKVDNFTATDRIITFKTTGHRTPSNDAGTGLEKSVKVASDAVVYNVVDTKKISVGSLSDITEGSYVVVDDYSATDDDYGVVVIFN